MQEALTMETNVQKKEHFNQVCVIHGLDVPDNEVKDFEEKVGEVFGVRIQFLETISTDPDLKDGKPVKDTGGRHDVFFAVHNDDISRYFFVRRLAHGIRWIEDVLAECNYQSPIYPKRVFDYCTWNKEALSHWGDK